MYPTGVQASKENAPHAWPHVYMVPCFHGPRFPCFRVSLAIPSRPTLRAILLSVSLVTAYLAPRIHGSRSPCLHAQLPSCSERSPCIPVSRSTCFPVAPICQQPEPSTPGNVGTWPQVYGFLGKPGDSPNAEGPGGPVGRPNHLCRPRTHLDTGRPVQL